MKVDLAGRVALVTGGAVRIGAAIVRALADCGAGVIVHYRRSRTEAEKLVSELQRRGAKAWAVRGSLDSEQGCRRVFDTAWRQAGRVDILVNNAAIFEKNSLTKSDSARIRRLLDTNLFAALWLTREFAARCESGCVVNLLDRRVMGWDTSCGPYVLSKKALAEVTMLLALELAPRIRVNAVAPGPVLPPPGRSARYMRDHAGPVPLKVKITAEDVAKAVTYLIAAEKVTGQILFVDGGQHLLNWFERREE